MKRRNRGETRGQRVNIEEEEKGARDRALRDSTAYGGDRKKKRVKNQERQQHAYLRERNG